MTADDRYVHSVRITAREELLINGTPFPWYIAEEGPHVIDEGGDGVHIVRIMVPVVAFSDTPIIDERPRSNDGVAQIVREMSTHQTLHLRRIYEALGELLEEADDGN